MFGRTSGSALVLLFACLATNAFAGGGKVDVCHRQGNGTTRIINVSSDAVAGHRSHGDHVVGPEVCDGVDNDCDGSTDEDIAPQPTSCGVGACAATGTLSCTGGVLVDSCTPGGPQSELCDGIDNDCDGSTDEDLAPVPSTCGSGLCSSTGELSCVGGTIVDSCAPRPPQPEICDQLDNDCDGAVDETGCGPTLPPNCRGFAFGGHTYAICQGSNTKPESENACSAIGMRLARMDTEAENRATVDAALAAFGCISYERTSYWIANLSADYPRGATWPSGNAVWAPGEPNGIDDSIHILRYCPPDQYGWNDAAATAWRWGWVCESTEVLEARTWDLAADFRAGADHANPSPDRYGNADVWRYVRGDERRTGGYSLLPLFRTTHPSFQQGLIQWGWDTGDGNPPYVTRAQADADLPVWWGVLPAGKLFVHPGGGDLVGVGWRSPMAGNVSIEGAVQKVHGCGNGVRWYVQKNGVDLASGYSSYGAAPQRLADGNGGASLGQVPVAQGDLIHLLIDRDGDYSCDSTRVDLTITSR